jgi:hypothetical protein
MNKHLYDEVYVVGPDSTVSIGGDLTVCSSFESLLEYLKTKNVSVNSDLRVVHGVLTSAKSIPKDLKGRQAFILLRDPADDDLGMLLDADADDDYNELGTEIERVLESNEVASFFFEIDDVYILYGYEMSLALSVDEDEIDENIIHDCKSIAIEARKLNAEDK